MAESNFGGIRLEADGRQKTTGDFRIAVPLLTEDATLGGLRAACATVASTAISNTTTETAFDNCNYTIPANALSPGRRVRVRFAGTATTTNSTDTLQIKVYLGSTAIVTGTATDVANSDIFAGWADIVCRTAGTSGTYIALSEHTIVPAATAVAKPVYELTGSTTVNTTTTQAITIKATWSAASTSDSCRMDYFSVEYL